jgi:hypothetical protein
MEARLGIAAAVLALAALIAWRLRGGRPDAPPRDAHPVPRQLRYEISAIPMILIADHEGVVHRAFVGATTATDLWAALAEVREPGTTPEPGLGDLD